MINYKKILIDKIKSNKSIIGIIGLGYVGLPLAISCVKNLKVIGFDIDPLKINSLKKNKSYIFSITNEQVKIARKNNFKITDNFSKLKLCDCIIICVPTPLNKFKQPDLSHVFDSIKTIKKNLNKGQLICLESTTYPGTTEEEILPLISKTGLKVGEDFFLAYSPEREDPGNKQYVTNQIPKLVGGVTSSCLDVASSLYNKIVQKVVNVSSPRVAEMTKLHENCFRLINTGFVNEMKILCDKFNINIHEVIEAASTKPFGFTPFYPGPGVGGHCIPIDPYYLSWKARQLSIDTEFINLANKINQNMPKWVIKKVNRELRQKFLSLKNSKVLFIGVSYKKNIDDLRESPSLQIIKEVYKYTNNISYSDNFIKKIDLRLYSNKNVKLVSKRLNKSLIKSFDIIFITTDHDYIDYHQIKENAKIIVDTRGVFTKSKNIIIA